MDKRNLLALVLITVIVSLWLFFTSTQQKPIPKEMQQQQNIDSIEKVAEIEKKPDTIPDVINVNDTLFALTKYGPVFAPLSKGTEREIRIETELVKATFSTKGAALTNWELKKYMKWDKVPSQLIPNDASELFITFRTYDNKNIDSRDLYFESENQVDSYTLRGGDSISIFAKLKVSEDKYIFKKFTFYGNKYHFDVNITVENMASIIPKMGYQLVWTDGLHYQEMNSVDESTDAEAMVSKYGGLETIDASGDEPISPKAFSGAVDYTAVKTKYFIAAIIPQPYKKFEGTVDLSGKRVNAPNSGTVEKYDMSFRLPYNGGTQHRSFKIYLGPLDYDIVSGYGLEDAVNFGWKWLVRPIGEYFMLPILTFIHKYFANYGIAIIIFSILIKLLLYPLSIGQMRSAQKMKLLTPQMNALREKYKDDNTKQQQETMKLYSEYGINPMGGCLPLLLQMPILYALWSVLRSAIDLRQADFMLWITDLSIPDSILHLGFKLPIIGIDQFSGLALLMGATLFFQQKLTVTDPRQKAMVWMMPIMFTFMFSNFPSGLNLYYFMFNLVSIIQQVWINNFSKNKMTLADLKRMPKKEGWFQKKMREAQDVAASQGRSIPGKKYDTDKKLPPPTKKPTTKGSPSQGGKKN